MKLMISWSKWAVRFLAAAAVALLFAACGDSTGGQSSAGRSCTPTNLTNCIATPPKCADTLYVCIANQCVYRRKNSMSCPCIQHDVRLCDVLPGPMHGIQRCVANHTGTATSWSACEPVPCIDGASRCVDADTYQMCDGDDWGAEQNCASGETCSDGVCE